MQELLLEGSLAAIHQAVLDRKISVREIATWYINRIQTSSKLAGLNAVRTLAPHALETARQLDDEVASGRIRGPLIDQV